MGFYYTPGEKVPMKFHYFMVCVLLPLSAVSYGRSVYRALSAAGIPASALRYGALFGILMLALCILTEIGLILRKNWGRISLFAVLAADIAGAAFLRFYDGSAQVVYDVVAVVLAFAVFFVIVRYYARRKYLFRKTGRGRTGKREAGAWNGEEAEEGDAAFFDASAMDLDAMTRAANGENAAAQQDHD